MTEVRRIILNIIVSYGRTLLGVVCGIFSTRWVLMALGQEDFGLFGVVGSLVIFVSFFNTQFSSAISRFYAYAIGRAKVSEDRLEGLRECQDWFSTALVIHTVLPVVLICIGYPLGVKVISNGWLVIPEGKVETCVWLWRYLMISCFIGMINVPFSAMYIAKQYISEMTIYSIVQVIVKTAFIYYMTTIPRDWLQDYGLVMCIIAVVPQIMICLRALYLFPECKFQHLTKFSCGRIKELASYALWQAFCGIGFLARHQCLEVVVNKFFGPKINASYTIGATVGGEAAALTGALNGAFTPAVTTVYGTGDKEKAKAYAGCASKFGTLLTLVFAIPMGLEIDEILHLWLKTPPVYANGLCLCWLGIVVVEKLTLGQIQLINASGDVSRFYLFRCIACLTVIPISVVFVMIYDTVYMVGVALFVSTVLVCISDALVARMKVGMELRHWVFDIIVPLVFISGISGICGLLPRCLMEASFFRVMVTTFVSFSMLMLLSWNFLLKKDERLFVQKRIMCLFGMGLR